ncbi:hypothetical protein FKM82_003485 [Ascaphus truei]
MGLDAITGVCLTVLAAEAITGISTNVFIVFVNFLDWFRGQNMNTCNKILVALSISNACYSCITAVNIFTSFIWPQVYTETYVQCAVFLLTTYSIFSSSWLIACLCFFYCMKIIHFSSGLLAWLKMKITIVVPWLMLVAEVVSVSSSFLATWPFPTQYSRNTSIIFSANMTSGESMYKTWKLYTVLIINCVPFLTVMVTTVCSIGSLYLHTHRIEKDMWTFGSANLNAHRGAIQTMMYLLLVYAILYVVWFLFSFKILVTPSFSYWISLMLMFSFTPVQLPFSSIVTPN